MYKYIFNLYLLLKFNQICKHIIAINLAAGFNTIINANNNILYNLHGYVETKIESKEENIE